MSFPQFYPTNALLTRKILQVERDGDTLPLPGEAVAGRQQAHRSGHFRHTGWNEKVSAQYTSLGYDRDLLLVFLMCAG